MAALDMQPDWPDELCEAEAHASGTAPVDAGQRVYLRGHPERGSLIVRDVYPVGAGWRVHAGADDHRGYELHTNAADLVACPAGWCEPPAMPTRIELVGDHYEPVVDEAAYPLWEQHMRRWLGRLAGSAK